jgi:hypothetical protein
MLRRNRGNVVLIFAELFWPHNNSWETYRSGCSLLIEFDPDGQQEPDAATALSFAEDYHMALVTINGTPRWLKLTEFDIEFLDENGEINESWH